MQQYLWKYRPLIIFSPAASPLLAKQQSDIRAAEAGYAERDIVVIAVVGSDVSTSFGPACTDTAVHLRAMADMAAEDSCAVLVGKDGGIKWSAPLPVDADRLFDVIDCMPMRQREMAEAAKS